MSKRMPPRGLSPWEIVKWHGWTEVVRVDHLGPCWEFSGPRMGNGYGSVEPGGRATLVHRISYEEHYFPLLDGEIVRHRCDNKPCMNPGHLESGTQADNNRDARERGQWKPMRGEGHGSAKLSEADVAEIRGLYKGRGKGPTQKSLAERFGVTQGTIAHITTGRNWKESA